MTIQQKIDEYRMYVKNTKMIGELASNSSADARPGIAAQVRELSSTLEFHRLRLLGEILEMQHIGNRQERLENIDNLLSQVYG